VVSAWDKVLPQTIFNCWKDAGILPLDDTDSQDEIEENEREKIEENERKEIQDLIDKLDLENPLTADEFVQFDGSEITMEMITNEEILKVILPNNYKKELEEPDFNPLPSITLLSIITK
jgi:hypothetical protein